MKRSWTSYAHSSGFPRFKTSISAQCMFQGFATRSRMQFRGFMSERPFSCLIRSFKIAYDMPRLPTWPCMITCRFTVAFSLFPGTRDDQLALQLQQEVLEFRSHLFAESTKKTYKTHHDTFLHFCHYLGYSPVPIQTDHLLQYATFLARSLKESSVRSYLNIIGLLHKEFGHFLITGPLIPC